MKKQIYSFFLVLVAVLFSAAPVYAQEENEEAVDALEKAEAKKFRGLEYEVPELKAELKSMCDQYLAYLQKDESARASRQLVVLMDTIMKKPFRQRVDGLVSVGHYFVQNRSEKAAVLCKDKIVQMDKAPTMRHTILFCAEVAELTEDYGSAMQYYDDLLYLDENDELVFNRKAYVGKFRNEDNAVADYKKLLTLNPNEYNAYKHIGDIYYSQALHETRYATVRDSLRAEAIGYYKKYFDAAPREEGSLEYRACQRYVFTMWERQLDPRHKENDSLRAVLRNNAREIAQLALDLKVAPDMYQQRLMHYYIFSSDLFNGNYELARQSRSYVTSKQFPDSIYTFNDYFYAAELELRQKKYQEAIPFYEQILANIPDSIKIYNNIIEVYSESLKLPSKAIPYKEKHLAIRGDKRMPKEDVSYVKLIKSAMKLASDSVEVDSLNKKLTVVSDTYLPFHTQRLEVDSVKGNLGLKVQLLKDIKDLYVALNKGEEGIPYYAEYLDLVGDSVTWVDQYDLAELYREICKADTLKRELYIEKADSLYNQVAISLEKCEPDDLYLNGNSKRLVIWYPWFYRAVLWITKNEPEENPKKYYEKSLELIPDENRFNQFRLAALDYLMRYYFMAENDVECMKYLEQVLILDPNNSTANQILEVLTM